MIKSDIVLSIALEPPDVECDSLESKEIFSQLSSMLNYMPVDSNSLFAVKDIKHEMPAIFDYFYSLGISRESTVLFGGCAFVVEGEYQFGADKPICFVQNWLEAFKRIEENSVRKLEVFIDDRIHRVLHENDSVIITHEDREFETSRTRLFEQVALVREELGETEARFLELSRVKLGVAQGKELAERVFRGSVKPLVSQGQDSISIR